jgi:glucose-6-phosphate isomerase
MIKAMKLRWEHALISAEAIDTTSQQLQAYLSELSGLTQDYGFSKPDSCVSLVSNQALLDEVMQIGSKKIKSNLKYVVVIGIGGSSLGAKAVYDAVCAISGKGQPQLIFLDSIQASTLSNLNTSWEKVLAKPEEVLVLIITKSGHTTEAVVNAEIVLQSLQRLVGDITDRIVVVTQPDSVLGKLAAQRRISSLSIPHNLSGRYSVFSAVGLLPLVAAGIDIVSLREGAASVLATGLSPNWQDNPALISAAITYLSLAQGKSMVDHFLFSPELATWGQWCRQLMAESLGKDGKGVTPLMSIGSTDLHSMTQLHLAGPKDKLISFISAEHQSDITVPPSDIFDGWAGKLVGRGTREIGRSLYTAATRAYQEAGMAHIEVLVDEISPRALGELLQWKMLETMLLAKLLQVNAFDQPAIEGYKKHVLAI